MVRITLAQMRRTLGRLVAAGVSIALGTAFVAATLLASGIISRTTVDSLTAGFADADLVVSGYPPRVAAEVLAAVPGVQDVAGQSDVYVRVIGPDGATALVAGAVAPVPALEPVAVVAGSMPAAPGEVALTGLDAERLGAALGDRVTVEVDRWAELREGEEGELTAELTLTGLLDPNSLALFGQGAARVVPAELDRWAVHQTGEDEPGFATLLATVAPGSDIDEVRASAA